MAFVSLIIPTYNESGNIGNICSALVYTLNSAGIDFEVIIVDDNSRDETTEIVQKLSFHDNRIKLIKRNRRGLAKAVVFGWSKAKGDILGVMDADMQHPVELLNVMLADILSNDGADIVVASRYIRDDWLCGLGIWRLLVSKFTILLCNLFFPNLRSTIKDPTSGYFLIRRDVIGGVNLNPIGFKILLEVILKGRYKKVREVPYSINRRKSGFSKASPKEFILFLLHIIRLRLSSVKLFHFKN